MKKCMEKLESLLELGGTKKDIALLVISGHRPALFVVRCTAPLFSGMDRHYIVRRSHRAGGGYRTGHPVRYQS